MKRLATWVLGLTMVVACGQQGTAPAETAAQASMMGAGKIEYAAAKPAATQKSHSERVARGKYLVSIMGCHDCHTPWKLGPKGPEPDMSRALSGHPEGLELPATVEGLGKGPWVWAGAGTNTAFIGPWGISRAMNLTPDENTGIGIWTEDLFIKTIRSGQHMGTGRPIMPPMPWTVYRNATDEDLGAIFQYLRTIKPIHNRIPDPEPPPVSAQTAM